jgi:hypothetical protein
VLLLLKQGRTPTAAGGWNAKGEVEELFDADDKTNEEKKKQRKNALLLSFFAALVVFKVTRPSPKKEERRVLYEVGPA